MKEAAATYRFTTKSSQYAAVEPLLKADPRYTAVTHKSYRLLLADRWDVPYARLGLDEGCKPLVNHLRGTKHITVKGLMVCAPRLLRAKPCLRRLAALASRVPLALSLLGGAAKGSARLLRLALPSRGG
jgi:hypothetical protein